MNKKQIISNEQNIRCNKILFLITCEHDSAVILTVIMAQIISTSSTHTDVWEIYRFNVPFFYVYKLASNRIAQLAIGKISGKLKIENESWAFMILQRSA